MVHKVRFKKLFPNPANLKAKGVSAKIVSAGLQGEDIVVTFENEPTQGEIQTILTFLQQGRYEAIEEGE